MKRERRDPCAPAQVDEDYAWCVENGYIEDAPEARARMLAGYEAMKDVLQRRTWRRPDHGSRRPALASPAPAVGARTAERREPKAGDDERASA